MSVLFEAESNTWVMQESTFAVRFLDLVFRGVLLHAEHFVVIFPLAFLQLQLSRFQEVLVFYRNIQSQNSLAGKHIGQVHINTHEHNL